MKVCIIGNGLVSLTLANDLVARGLSVDVFSNKKHKEYNQNQTLGIARSNVEYFNKNILNIEKILWKINNIKIYSGNVSKNEILNFKGANKYLFSVTKNYQLYKLLEKKLKKNSLFKYKKNTHYKNIIKEDYKLIINCDYNHEITKKFFSNKIKKKYDSFAFTTIINHKKIDTNDVAIQIFTEKGPIAFLPISKTKTSVVCSLRHHKNENKIDINNLIKIFNPKYRITKINKIGNFELRSANLRKYYKNNILAFGDLLHMIHPLAGQGFNMSLRDIKELTRLIDNRIKLGLDLDSSICVDFQNKMKHKNYIFSQGIDLIYEFFNFQNKFKSNILNNYINFIGKNKLLNNLFKKFADRGLQF